MIRMTGGQFFLPEKSTENNGKPQIRYGDTGEFKDIIIDKGIYPNLTAGKADTLSSFIVKGRLTTNIGWHKAMEIKAVNIGNVGQAGYSALILVNGVRGSTGESVTPAGSSIIEIDCRADAKTNGVFLAGFLRINILNGWLNTKDICAVLSEDSTTISVYVNIKKQYMQYNFTKLSEGAEGIENVNALTFIDEYYGSSAPNGAVYATILNNAAYADELTYLSVGTTATGNQNWYEIATVPVNASAYDGFSIILLLNGRTVGAQMSGLVELEGRCEPNNWTYKNFKVLCGNLASTHIAYYEDSDKTIHFYLWAPSTTYAISTISAQRGNGLNITNPLTELQPEELPAEKLFGANFNYAGYDSQSNYIPNTYAKINEVSNPNIIINPDFSINQRGGDFYEASDSSFYTVDRIYLHKYAIPVLTPKTGGGISVSGTATGSNNFILSYFVEEYAKYAGKTLTLSVKLSNVTGSGLKIRTSSTSTGDYSGSITTDMLYTKTFTVNESPTALSIVVTTASAGDFSFDIDWWKLEEGYIATAFTKPLISEELPKCQRYMRLVHGFKRAVNGYQFYEPFQAFYGSMRISPTIIHQYSVSQNGVIGTTENGLYDISSNSEINVSVNPRGYINEYGCTIQNGDGTFTADHMYRYVLYVDAEIYS